VVIPRYPVIQTIKEELFQRGARGSLMSGSGSTVYGIFSTKEEAQEALAQLKGHREWKIQLTSSM
jgi:4-diphosphocytidyl-2-C-methyl-D-erythritol kinase